MGTTSRRKTVAIIGAGPAGLTTAKSMLESGLDPQVFEAQSGIGGLWSCGTGLETSCHEDMRTNLSRWTCSFGDFSWKRRHFVGGNDGEGSTEAGNGIDDILRPQGLPAFPTVRQMNRYLRDYARTFIPEDTIKLNAKVTKVELLNDDSNRGERKRWKVTWEELLGSAQKGEKERESKFFDHLVMASGFFATGNMNVGVSPPLTPKNSRRICHSSRYTLDDLLLTPKSPLMKDIKERLKVVVVGGCLSSVEVVSRITMQIAEDSSRYPGVEVIHLFPRPFWTIPYHIPAFKTFADGVGKNTMGFLPLDLIMYEANRRQKYSSEQNISVNQRNRRINEWLKALEGNGDQSQISSLLTIKDSDMELPPYLAISDTYINLVRTGEITLKRGYLYTIEQDINVKEQKAEEDETPFTLKVSSMNSKSSLFPKDPNEVITETIENVAGVVYATGYNPHPAFSYLPQDILKAMDRDNANIFLPLLLYKQILHPSLISYSSANSRNTINSTSVVHGGFVGFYKGPFFGVMELQGKYLAKLFSGELAPPDIDKLNEGIEEMGNLRQNRNSGTWEVRDQYSSADYIGIMLDLQSELSKTESLSNSQIVTKTDLPFSIIDKAISMSPYANVVAPIFSSHFYDEANQEATKAIESLNNYIKGVVEKGYLTARAVFRSLQGNWKVNRRLDSRLSGSPSGIFVGTAKFIPRKETFKIPSEDRGGKIITQDGINPVCGRDDPLPLLDITATSHLPDSGTTKEGIKYDKYEVMGRDDLIFPTEYVYSETGTFTFAVANYSIPASRQYIYRYEPEKDVISVWFVKPSSSIAISSSTIKEREAEVDYHFHNLKFHRAESGGKGFEEGEKRNEDGVEKAIGFPHLCEMDLYKPEYEFYLRGAELEWFTIGYNVKGPAKDYVTLARYER